MFYYNIIYFSSPVQQKSVSSSKVGPQRPPPPKLVPRLNIPKQRSLDSELAIHKPKPPVRTRKKKFHIAEDVPPSRQSEFVEISTSDIVVETGDDGEMRVVSEDVPSAETEQGKMDTVVEDAVQEDREEAESGERNGSDSENRTESNLDLVDRDEWEVIPDSVTNRDSSGVTDEPCLQPNGYIILYVHTYICTYLHT